MATKYKNGWFNVWNEYKRAEGGRGKDVLYSFKEKGIPAKIGGSIYVGMIGVLVPKEFVKRAQKLVNSRSF